jgi:hypothetical protein
MKKQITLLLCVVSGLGLSAQTVNVSPGYTIPAKEINCFRHFNHNQAPGRNKINTYLLSKLSQMVYTERLDFELRKLRNPSTFPSAGFRSDDLNSSSNAGFEVDFAKRFSHWFYDINAKPQRPVALNIGTPIAGVNDKVVNTDKLVINNPNITTNTSQELPGGRTVQSPKTTTTTVSAMEKFIADSIAFEKSKPQFKFLNKREDFASFSFAANEVRIPGFDPEVMVISTEEYIIINWRGTDDIYKDDAWEWIATDFYFIPVAADGPLAGAKMHAGLWTSFKIIRTKLMNTLNAFEAKSKNKKIFLTGHSLGGGMALLSAPFLAGNGYNVAGVYSFAGPRVIGDQEYVNKCNSLLGQQKIQRFEYGVDPVTKFWSPALYFSAFKIPGVRNWWSATAGNSNDEFYDTDERVFPMTMNPVEYNGYSKERIDRLNGDIGNLVSFLLYAKDAVAGNTERPKDLRGFVLADFGHHNPGYYTLKAYAVLSETDKAKLPAPENTFPYVFPGVNGNR